VAYALRHPQLGADFQQVVNRAAERPEDPLAAPAGARSARHLTLVSS
jgi:hypothetical protein